MPQRFVTFSLPTPRRHYLSHHEHRSRYHSNTSRHQSLNGNRTDGSSVVSSDNQMSTDASGATYAYDANGNRTLMTNSDTSYVAYTWDYRNRLTEIDYYDATSSHSLTESIKYAYNAFNQRISMADFVVATSATTTESYFYDGTNLVLVLNASDAVVNRYLMGPSQNQVFAEETVSGGTNTTRWAITDQQGTVRDIVSNSGALLNHIVYTAFGQIYSQTDSTNSIRMLYTGQVHDFNTGLDYDNARYYDSAAGRFINQDPLGFRGGDTNLSRYVANDPVNATDPTGTTITFQLDPRISQALDSQQSAKIQAIASLPFDKMNFPPEIIKLLEGLGNKDKQLYPDHPEITAMKKFALVYYLLGKAAEEARNANKCLNRGLGYSTYRSVSEVEDEIKGKDAQVKSLDEQMAKMEEVYKSSGMSAIPVVEYAYSSLLGTAKK